MSMSEFLVGLSSAADDALFHAAFSDGSSGRVSVTVKLRGERPHVVAAMELTVTGGVRAGEEDMGTDCKIVINKRVTVMKPHYSRVCDYALRLEPI